MAGRITKGPNSPSLNDLEYAVIVTATDGSPALAVTNTDGSAISGGGGGGGGAVTVADGADVTQGALADAAITAGSTGSVSGKLRQISADISSLKTTQPLPTGGATSANQATEISSLSTIATNTTGVATAANQSTANTSLSAIATAQTNGTQQVQGNVASGATDSGNPQKVGGVQRATQPTLADGQRGDAQMDTRANMKVTLMGNGTSTAVTLAPTNADGVATSATGSRFEVVSRNSVYNGTTYDRLYSANAVSNTTGTGLAGSGQMVWDGTNWQRQKADTTGIPMVNTQLYPNSTALNTYSIHLTSNTTTTPTAATAYISSITISSEVAGTTSTVTIQDKQGTPLKLVNGLSTTTLTTTPTVVNFQTPVKMVNGIDIITAGAAAATVDVWINYYQ